MMYTQPAVYEFIGKQTSDPIVERKTCRISGTQFPIFQSDMEFYQKISPTLDGQHFQIPTPTLCPEERQRRRISFKNERTLYKRTCDATGEGIISIYAPDTLYKVYKNEYRWSDSRDALQYGFEYDFTLSFTENYRRLYTAVPKDQLTKDFVKQENCEYTNASGPAKNCYMMFEIGYDEHCYYGNSVYNSRSVLDGSYVDGCEYCFQVVGSVNCFHCRYLIDCADCRFSDFLFNCTDCEYCFMCQNLIGKKYCMQNVQYTKEEYESHMKKIASDKKTSSMYLSALQQGCYHPAYHGIENDRAYGDYIWNTTGVCFGYDCTQVEQSKYIYGSTNAHSSYDINTRGENMSYCIELEQCGRNISKCGFSQLLFANVHDILYSSYCIGCSDLFGCEGLRNKQYCIFNKQYTREEYEQRVAKIIGHMQETGERGEFFHPSLSPFGYNETVAQEYYPLTPTLSHGEKEHAIDFTSFGYKRSLYEAPRPQVSKMLRADELPSIEEVTDEILSQAIQCEVTGKPFRIIKPELEFYRQHQLPLPRRHPDQRHHDRMALRPSRQLFLRQCDQCGVEMVSVYGPHPGGAEGDVVGASTQEPSVLCEACYRKAVYA